MRNLIKHLKYFLLIIIALTFVIPFTSVFALDPPISTQLISVNAYQDCIEAGDMLFVAYGEIKYSTYPTDYYANDTFVLKMYNSTPAEIVYTSLFANPYFHGGYGKFMASFYFTSIDVVSSGLIWNGSYLISLEPNPLVSWNGTAPTSTNSTITWSGTGQTARILYIMAQLQAQWGVSLIDSGTLTTAGENYAISVIPYLRYISPTMFSSYQVSPEYHQRTPTSWTYALTLGNQWVGTWFDLTNLSAALHIPKVWLYAGIWLIFMAFIIFAVIEAPAIVTNTAFTMPAAKNTKMIFYLVIIMVFFGGITGFLPWLSLILVGFILIIMIVNQVFFQKSYG